MPRLAIAAKIGQRIRSLAGEGKSGRQISAVIEGETGAKIDRRTVDRYLEKHHRKTSWFSHRDVKPANHPSEPGRRARAPGANAPPTPLVAATPLDETDVDEVGELRANARILRAAMSDAEPKELAGLAAEHRKTLAAIRAAKGAGRGDTSDADRAAAIRERLMAFLPPSPPTYAEQQSADQSVVTTARTKSAASAGSFNDT